MAKLNYTTSTDSSLEYSHKGDAGIDLRSSGIFIVDLDENKKELVSDSYELMPGDRILVKTGIVMEIPSGYFGNIRDRSGLAFKHGIHTLAGIIDEEYRGEIGVVLMNLGKKPFLIEKGDRIAQIIITPYKCVELCKVEILTDTVRGEGGFGSTGKQ